MTTIERATATARTAQPVRRQDAATARTIKRRRALSAAPDVVLVAYVVLVARTRYRILANGAGLTGFDPGNWLSLGNALFGQNTRTSSASYPPVVPFLAKSFVSLWGADVGMSRLAALGSMMPALGVYLVMRSRTNRWAAAFAAGLLAASSSVGEAATWGGYPQLFGLGILPLALWRWDAFLIARRKVDALTAGLLYAALFATSHFIGLGAAAGALVLLAWHLATEDRSAILRAWPRFLLAALPLAPLVPFYVDFAPSITGSVSSRNGRLTNPLAAERFTELRFISRDSPTLWLAAFAMLLVVTIGFFRRRRTVEWRLVAAGLALTVLTTVFLGDARVIYFYPTFAVMAVAVVASEGFSMIARLTSHARRSDALTLRTVAVVCLAYTTVVQTTHGIDLFRAQRDFYGRIDPYVEESILWIRDSTPSNALIATPMIDGGGWGWWMEGLGERRTLVASDLKWLNFADEQTRAKQAQAIFDLFPSLGAIELARSFGVSYLVVPSNSDGYQEAATRAFVLAHPELVAFQNPHSLVIAVPQQ